MSGVLHESWSVLLLLVGIATVGASRADTAVPARAVTPPRCGSGAYRAMTDDARRHCREQAEAARSKCSEVVREMSGCTTGIRVEGQLLTFHIALGGEWAGARFERRAARWIFVSFVGGDIP